MPNINIFDYRGFNLTWRLARSDVYLMEALRHTSKQDNLQAAGNCSYPDIYSLELSDRSYLHYNEQIIKTVWNCLGQNYLQLNTE